VSDGTGTYTIANVPPGTYEIEAHHRRAGKSTRKVTVGSDPVKVDFTLEVPNQ
jgi:hypothetical protein